MVRPTINHDGLVRLLLYLDTGATVHFPGDPVIVGMDGYKGWIFKSKACGLTAVQPPRSRSNLVGRTLGLGGGGQEEKIWLHYFSGTIPLLEKRK